MDCVRDGIFPVGNAAVCTCDATASMGNVTAQRGKMIFPAGIGTTLRGKMIDISARNHVSRV